MAHVEDGNIGYFFAAVSIIITLYWIYRGLRRGLYPALNMFLVFFLALLVALNYYDLMFALIGKIAPKTGIKVRECIGFVSMYLLAFTFFLYFCLWLCAEKLPVQKVVNGLGGAVFGAVGGIVCSGVLLLMWFHMPFAERDYPVDDADMFFPCHKFTMGAAELVGRQIPGGRPFYGRRLLRDIRYGLPSTPSLGSGYYVSSVPTGLRVFLSKGRGDWKTFIVDLKGYVQKPRGKIAPSEKERIGDHGFTPTFIESTQDSALIAVVMDKIPARLGKGPNTFVRDGEVGISTPSMEEQALFIKVYRVEKDENIGTLVALFQPSDPKREDMVEDFLPSRECFDFNDDLMKTDLMAAGAVHEEAVRLVEQVHYGGKAYFLGVDNKPAVVEVTAQGKWRIFDPEALYQPEEPTPTVRGRPRR